MTTQPLRIYHFFSKGEFVDTIEASSDKIAVQTFRLDYKIYSIADCVLVYEPITNKYIKSPKCFKFSPIEMVSQTNKNIYHFFNEGDSIFNTENNLDYIAKQEYLHAPVKSESFCDYILKYNHLTNNYTRLYMRRKRTA